MSIDFNSKSTLKIIYSSGYKTLYLLWGMDHVNLICQKSLINRARESNPIDIAFECEKFVRLSNISFPSTRNAICVAPSLTEERKGSYIPPLIQCSLIIQHLSEYCQPPAVLTSIPGRTAKYRWWLVQVFFKFNTEFRTEY